ncbi:MAG: thioredoxin domain-containing protein [Bacteriovorax sp.]|nr:thioredoxin domain-containing protein [Bacteriovorax sp.]
MKKNKLSFTLTGLFAVMIVFFACQKNADSKPNFIFKPAPSAGVVASIGSEQILEKDLEAGIESDVYDAEMKVFEIKFGKLQAMLLEKFMNQDPNKKGLTNDEFLNKYIAKDVKVTDAEIEKFIKERQIPKDQVNPEIRERIKQYLEVESKKLAVDKWIADKTKKTPVEVYLKKPQRPVFDVNTKDAPFKGGSDAKVTIVEYSDFQCPFCSKAAVTVAELEKKYGNKVKVAFKNYPLPFHSQARLAAEAALCANEQSAKLFWKMHDAMFADQSKLDKDNLIASAKKIGVKEAEFKTCLEATKFKAVIDADMAQGQKLGIKSTPTFFINGKLVSGAQPVEVFSEVIDEELAK